MYVDSICDMEVAKNSRGEIIWPEKDSVAQICEAAGNEQR